MSLLAVLLLFPWLLVLSFLYWIWPRALPRTPARRLFDVLAIVAALVVAVELAIVAQHGHVPTVTDTLGHRSGDIWPQVLAALYAYAGFCCVLGLAMTLRQLIWRRGKP